MRKTALFAAIVLLGSVTLAPAFSDDDYNDNNHQEKDGLHFWYSNKTISYEESNKTMGFGESNKTMGFGESNETGIGHEISDFVHKRNELEKEKRDAILAVQKACISSAQQSGNKTAMMQCREAVQSLREQYRSFVSQQNTQFQQFREGLISNHAMIMPQQNTDSLNNMISQVSHGPHAIISHGNGHKNNHGHH